MTTQVNVGSQTVRDSESCGPSLLAWFSTQGGQCAARCGRRRCVEHGLPDYTTDVLIRQPHVEHVVAAGSSG